MRGTRWASTARAGKGTTLRDGDRVAVIGSGPAGSFFAIFLLEFADRLGLSLDVDLFETREFTAPAPRGCNMCGGIVSESLVQMLATEGIQLPPTVIQRGIDSYVLHTDVGDVRIATPLHEKRIGAVHRGGGPRDVKDSAWGSFDAHLQSLALGRGARLVAQRVDGIEFVEGRPRVRTRDHETRDYDLLGVAIGVNTGSLGLFEQLGIGYTKPGTTKTFIREYFFGAEEVARCAGSAMHVFLLDLPRLEFAAVIPKGDYLSVCLLGDEIDDELVQTFLTDPAVRACFPAGWVPDERSCQCAPRISVAGAHRPWGDRIVFVGDCAVTRLYKDGIGAAYKTAKAAARTAAFEGISAAAFEKYYDPTCRAISRDNAVGRLTFGVTRLIQKIRFARRGVLRMVSAEQNGTGRRPRMSGVLWDMFTGSASYTDVLFRTLHPIFLLRLLGNLGAGLKPGRVGERRAIHA